MKSEELRIGNWVWNPVQKIPVQVDIRLLNDIFYYEKVKKDSGWEQIELTEQWLIDLGFKKGKKGFWFQGGVEYNPKKFDLSFFGYVEIKYVHQLQNLYFSLTGEELIKKATII